MTVIYAHDSLMKSVYARLPVIMCGLFRNGTSTWTATDLNRKAYQQLFFKTTFVSEDTASVSTARWPVLYPGPREAWYQPVEHGSRGDYITREKRIDSSLHCGNDYGSNSTPGGRSTGIASGMTTDSGAGAPT